MQPRARATRPSLRPAAVRRTSAAAVAALALFASVTGTSPAAAAPIPPASVKAAWTFNFVDASNRVPDASGRGRPLTLAGNWSRVAGSAGTGAVRFSLQSYGSNPATSMSPGTAEVAVTAVLRTWVPKPVGDHPNVLQHGLYADPGQVKMQITKDGTGRVNCRFKGTLNQIVVTGPWIDVTDGAWHSATCWRSGAVVGVTVDGVTTTRTRDVGSVLPTRALTVASRGLAPADASDQFQGDIDTVVWAIGTGARADAPAYAAALSVP